MDKSAEDIFCFILLSELIKDPFTILSFCIKYRLFASPKYFNILHSLIREILNFVCSPLIDIICGSIFVVSVIFKPDFSIFL